MSFFAAFCVSINFFSENIVTGSRAYDIKVPPNYSRVDKNSLLHLILCGFMKKMYNLITWPKNFVFGQVLFSSACMCLSVCLSVCMWVCISIISKSSKPISMKPGRMVYNDNISVVLKMRWIGSVKRIPRPFEILKLPYLTQFKFDFK